MRLRTFVFLVVALLFLASGGAVWSQTVQGVITGAITDPTGAVVPGATVTITNVGTGISQSVTTGSDGSYRFPLVPPGTYTIEIKAANFATVRVSGIVVEASQTIPYNRQLELAKAQQIIEVTEQAPLVQTATSDLSTQIDRETIVNAPLVDRDVFSTLPFLAAQTSPGLDLMPTSAGARESGTAYLLNGGDDNDNFSEGAVNIHPPLESVEDFSIKTNSMTAEYGRGGGAVVTATQVSGSNKFHGVAYEFNRNASLNANDWFYNRDHAASVVAHQNDPTVPVLPDRPKYIRNQFGGIISGPIRKDKTFFSFAYDRFKILSGSTSANTFVPTSAGLANLETFANGNGTSTTSIAKEILTLRPPRTSDQPCPNGGNYPAYETTAGGNLNPGPPRTGAGTNPFTGLPNALGCLSFFDPETDTNDSYYGRLDHNFSANDRVSFTANVFRETFVDKFGTATASGGPLTTIGPISGTTTNHFHQLAVNETHTFNPRLVNEITLSHNRHFNVGFEGNGIADKIPNILIDNAEAGSCVGYFLGGDFEGGQVVGFVQDRWGLTDNVTFTMGRHNLKFGGGTQAGILYRNWDLGLPGQYEFASLDSVNAPTTADTTMGHVGNPIVAPCALTSTCPQITPTSDGTLNPVDGTISGVNYPNSNFANDYPYFQETSIDPKTGLKASAYRHYTYHDYYWFVQDDWKLSPRLTLNLGLRWDRYGAPSEDHGILAQFTNFSTCGWSTDRACIAAARVNPVGRMWQTRNKDFGPRVGFAWDPFGKGRMAVRGGYGIYYDRIFDNIWSNGAWNPPFYALIDFNAACSDSIFYSNPNSIGLAYDTSNPIPHPGKRVSVRTMDVNMKDASTQNYYLSVERQVLGSFLFRVGYQGSMGRHLPMLEYVNRTDGQAYNVTYDTSTTPPTYVTSLSNRRPNRLYTGFNYRADKVNSSYNSLVAEVQKRMSHGLQFQTGYTFGKLLDLNSELFAGCSTIGSFTAPYYFVSNAQPTKYRGPAAYDHRHSYKFSVTYELPFQKSQKGVAGHALGGWSLGSFFQYYFGHPIDVYVGNSSGFCQRFAALDASGNPVLDQNGIPFNIAGDYNEDGVCNDHPNFVGSSVNAAYSGKNPAGFGIFTDNNQVGCGFAGMPATVANIGACNVNFGVTTPSTLFVNPAYPGGLTPYERFGTLGRGVFHGPKFSQLDVSVNKSFKLTETTNLQFRAQAQNVLNHPSFDCVESNLNAGLFGHAECLTQSIQAVGGIGTPKSRVMSLGLRFSF